MDTNVVSETRRAEAGRADRNVVAWMSAAAKAALHLSVITIMELEMGTLSLGRRDPRQAAILRAWLDTRVLPAFDGRLLPVSLAIAQRCTRLHVPNPQPERDALIAATQTRGRLTAPYPAFGRAVASAATASAVAADSVQPRCPWPVL